MLGVVKLEIKIRDLDPATVKKIDRLATDKGLSRQVYLKEHLEAFAVNDLHSSIIDRYEKQLEVNTMLLEKNAEKMDEMMEVFRALMFEDE